MPRATKLTPQQCSEIAQRYQSGERGQALAQAFGISMTSVYDVLKQQGVPRYRKLSPEQRQAINSSCYL